MIFTTLPLLTFALARYQLAIIKHRGREEILPARASLNNNIGSYLRYTRYSTFGSAWRLAVWKPNDVLAVGRVGQPLGVAINKAEVSTLVVNRSYIGAEGIRAHPPITG